MSFMQLRRVCILIAVGAIVPAITASAEVPHEITYQGRLTDSLGSPTDTTVDMTFYLYEAPGGDSPMWTETHPDVEVVNGLFTVQLGTFVTLDKSILDGNARFLGVQAGSGPVSSPLAPLVSTAYAYRAGSADTAAYAHAGPGSGASGWVDDGAVVRLSTAGDYVGIGTSSPGENLVVGGNLGSFPEANYVVSGNPDFEGYSGFKLGWNSDNHATINWLGDGDQLRFSTRSVGTNYNNTMVMSNGHVGIGTESPAFRLEVMSSGSSDGVRVTSSDGSQLFRIRESSGGSCEAYVSDDIGNTGVLLRGIGNSYFNAGNVGVGTDTPGFKLEVKSGGASDGVRVTSSDAEQLFRVRENSDGSCETQISDAVGAVGVMLRGGGNSYFNAGNVGIGTTSPTAKLHVVGDPGDSSVVLPYGSVSSTEIANEAGLASVSRGSPIELPTFYAEVCSRTCVFPAIGHAVVIATFELEVNRQSLHFDFGLVDDAHPDPPHVYTRFINSDDESGDNYDCITIHQVFEVNPGTNTFHLLVRSLGTLSSYTWDAAMTIMYFPTAYGSITKSSGVEGDTVVFSDVTHLDAQLDGVMSKPEGSGYEALEERVRNLEDQLARLTEER